MLKQVLIAILFILSLSGVEAQYISQVLDYRPAPGQFVNALPWAAPTSARSVVGGISGSLSLGAFGGYVVFRFDGPVENHPENPYGVDFTIFGNPLPNWSEPGAVWVMKDENENGLADDSWYELAGSDYWFSTSKTNYSLSYSNPGGSEARDVPWVDAYDSTGVIKANSVHDQSYYPLPDSFPDIDSLQMWVGGTRIAGAVDVDHPPILKSLKRAFGYADNQFRGEPPHTLPDNPYTPEVENSGGDAFDINWAVDSAGNYVELDVIHFVKVQTAVLHQGGWLGEVSTEITGAVDVEPQAGVEGEEEVLVILDLPPEIKPGTHRLEAIRFLRGRPVEESDISWNCSQDWAAVDQDRLLHITDTGPLTVTATVQGKTRLEASVSTLVVPEEAVGLTVKGFPELLLYPNPALEHFSVRGCGTAGLSLYDMQGKQIWILPHYEEGSEIYSGDLEAGLYLLGISGAKKIQWVKLRIL